MQIIWSELAENDFSNILEYLYENWSVKLLINLLIY